MLSHDEAAEYCGFKTTRQFLQHARSRVAAVNFGNYERWDRHQLDQWLDTLSGGRVSDAKISDADIIAAAFTKGKIRTRKTPKTKGNP